MLADAPAFNLSEDGPLEVKIGSRTGVIAKSTGSPP